MTMLSPASEGASARKQGMPIKCFGHYVPLYKGERENIKTDYPRYTKALKHEKKAREKCARTCNDPKAFKKAKYNYLTSERCLLANMLEANKRRPYAKRLSLHEMIEASK